MWQHTLVILASGGNGRICKPTQATLRPCFKRPKMSACVWAGEGQGRGEDEGTKAEQVTEPQSHCVFTKVCSNGTWPGTSDPAHNAIPAEFLSVLPTLHHPTLSFIAAYIWIRPSFTGHQAVEMTWLRLRQTALSHSICCCRNALRKAFQPGCS